MYNAGEVKQMVNAEWLIFVTIQPLEDFYPQIAQISQNLNKKSV